MRMTLSSSVSSRFVLFSRVRLPGSRLAPAEPNTAAARLA
jgi:hypothetical protein